MKRIALVLALAGLATGAHAATWTLENTVVNGLRSGQATLTDSLGVLGTTGEVLSGAVTDHLNQIGLDSVAVGSWDAKGITLGGNSVEFGLSHEVYAGLDGADTAYVDFLTSVSLGNATIVDSGLNIDFSGSAPVSLTQNFVVTPELGEASGDLVKVYVNLWANHEGSGELAVNTLNLNDAFDSNYALFLNGNALNSGSHTGSGLEADSWSFLAHIGDVVSLQMASRSQMSGNIGSPEIDHLQELLVTSRGSLSMTVSAVPEPETWGMLIAGLGLMGLRLRSKTKSASLKIGA